MTRFSFRPLILAVLMLLFLPAQVVQGQANPPTRFGVFEALELQPGAVVEIPIRIENAQNLFALDFEMTFDPEIGSVQDADPTNQGIQLGLGQFLDPGLLLYNTVDNENGVMHFVMTQVNPSQPKSGDGILLVIYFKALKAGTTDLKITNLQIADDRGLELAAEKVESSIKVANSAPVVVSTSIPVTDPTLVMVIPTLAPSAIPIQAPQPASTPLARMASPTIAPTMGAQGLIKTNHPDPTRTVQAGPLANDTASAAAQTRGFSLLDNWWIVVLAIGLVAGLGFYLYRTQEV